jgi:hypothetical protein
MRKTRQSRPSTFFVALVSLAAGLGIAACGGDGSETGEPPEPTGALNASVCAEFARSGRVDICHAGASDSADLKVLTVTQQACSTEHAAHADDFVASEESGCKQAKAPNKCKLAGASCTITRAADCCTQSCQWSEFRNKYVCG